MFRRLTRKLTTRVVQFLQITWLDSLREVSRVDINILKKPSQAVTNTFTDLTSFMSFSEFNHENDCRQTKGDYTCEKHESFSLITKILLVEWLTFLPIESIFSVCFETQKNRWSTGIIVKRVSFQCFDGFLCKKMINSDKRFCVTEATRLEKVTLHRNQEWDQRCQHYIKVYLKSAFTERKSTWRNERKILLSSLRVGWKSRVNYHSPGSWVLLQAESV